MNPPAPPDPSQITEHVLAVGEFWAKVAGVAIALWQFIERVAKPYNAWRRKRQGEVIRAILKEELECLATMQESGDRNAHVLEDIRHRQDEIFRDLDDFLRIAADSIERHEETASLLDAVGLSSPDRRHNPAERRQRFDDLMSGLHDRQRERRRRVSGDLGLVD